MKDVLAIEQPRESEAAQPSQLAMRDDRLDGGSESHRSRTGRPEEDVESGTDQRVAVDSSDEGVPIRKLLEIDQDGPHMLGGRVDFDLGPKF